MIATYQQIRMATDRPKDLVPQEEEITAPREITQEVDKYAVDKAGVCTKVQGVLRHVQSADDKE